MMRIHLHTMAQAELTEDGVTEMRESGGVLAITEYDEETRTVRAPLWKLMRVFGPIQYRDCIGLPFIDNQIVVADQPPKPKPPPTEIIRNDQTMTPQARIARRFRIVRNGEKFRVQERRWWRWRNVLWYETIDDRLMSHETCNTRTAASEMLLRIVRRRLDSADKRRWAVAETLGHSNRMGFYTTDCRPSLVPAPPPPE